MTGAQGDERVLYIPHGGGPLPLLGDPGHADLVEFLARVPARLAPPAAILVVSAHWEEPLPTVTAAAAPPLIYDYYGFPPESYQIRYPAPGEPALATRVRDLLVRAGIDARLDPQRGFDHGLYVPLKIMYPAAEIPCVQLSLVRGLDPGLHLRIGRSLASLGDDGVLVLGSGFSFHNMRAFLASGQTRADPDNDAFQDWLIAACTNDGLSEHEREARLANWAQAPGARYCHPREEHLLPLHVCYGAAGHAGQVAFDGHVLGKRACAIAWRTGRREA